MLAYSDTHTHTQTLRVGSESRLTSPTRTCLDFFSITTASLRWCICDIWRCSLYSWVLRYKACRREREREKRTRVMVAWDGRMTEGKQKKEWARVRERTPNLGDTDGQIHWQIYYELLTIKPQAPRIPQQNAWVPPSGRPAVIWPFWCCGGVGVLQWASMNP